jgi:hypothetical protein
MKTNVNLNAFARKVVSILCCILILGCQSVAGPQQPLSPAVTANAGRLFVKSLNYAKTYGRFRASDLYQSYAAAKILFAHMDETGQTDAIEKEILALDPASFSVDDSTVSSLRTQINMLGTNLTNNDVRNLLNISPDQVAGVISVIKKFGLRRVEAQTLAILQQRAEIELASSSIGATFHVGKVFLQTDCDINTGVCFEGGGGSCDCNCMHKMVSIMVVIASYTALEAPEFAVAIIAYAATIELMMEFAC